MSSSSPHHVLSKASSFELFSLLAPEIRLKVWQYACPLRTVSLRYIPEQDICLSPSKPPAVLQVCHESRTEALRTYTLSFGTQSSAPRIYFNPYRDVLYLPRHRQMGYDDTLRDFRSLVNPIEKQILDEVSIIAIDHVNIELKRPWEAYNKAALMQSFPKLREVLLVQNGANRTYRSMGLGQGEDLVEPKQDPELSLRLWAEFRQSIMMEEKVMEDIARMNGQEYVKWQLPTVRIRSKETRCA
ncbi:hypothetical protein B0O99DRAFT_515620 [Bisporella sp. PMI_857]|nr:hypothetical protein B0O99DRAFT_515620 [Bisporella sp. PMI_857]